MQIIPNSNSLEVLTHEGFKPFDGIMLNEVDEYMTIHFEDDTFVECTEDHKFFSIEANDYIEARNLSVGNSLRSKNGQKIIKSFEHANAKIEVFDLLNVRDTHSFYANENDSHNCLFMDEVAHIPGDLFQEFFKSVYPTISSGKSSKIIMVSCVTPDTFVYTPKGIRRVEDFIDRNKIINPKLGYSISNYDVQGAKNVNSGSVMVNSGRTETRILKTVSSSLECSLEHKVLTGNNLGEFKWKKSKDINNDDYIAVGYGHDLWGDNDSIPGIKVGATAKGDSFDKITPDLSYLFGLYISEGSVNYKYYKGERKNPSGITLTCGDSLKPILNKLNLPFYLRKRSNLHYQITSSILCRTMESLGFNFSRTAKEKKIPNRLLSMSRENIIALLQGIMDGDGWSRKDRGTVGISLSSKELILQLRAIFNNLGILSQYSEGITKPTKKVKVESPWFRLSMNKEMSQRYYNLVGFRFDRKHLKEENLNFTSNPRDSKDVVPGSKKIILGLKERNPTEYKRLVETGVLKGNYGKRPHFSRKFLLSNIEVFKSIDDHFIQELINTYVDQNIRWEKVQEISKSENEVFDFSLNHIDGDPWCHSVIYNSVIGHQTPNGVNHFYDIVEKARTRQSSFVLSQYSWRDVPGYDEEWAKQQIADTSQRDFDQEFNCVSGDTLVYLRDKQSGEVYEMSIDEAYNRMGISHE